MGASASLRAGQCPPSSPRGLQAEVRWTGMHRNLFVTFPGAHQALNQRRLRIEHVHSSVKRCRIVQDRIRLGKQGVRDLVRARCGALYTFRVRLSPWPPMVEGSCTCSVRVIPIGYKTR